MGGAEGGGGRDSKARLSGRSIGMARWSEELSSHSREEEAGREGATHDEGGRASMRHSMTSTNRSSLAVSEDDDFDASNPAKGGGPPHVTGLHSAGLRASSFSSTPHAGRSRAGSFSSPFGGLGGPGGIGMGGLEGMLRTQGRSDVAIGAMRGAGGAHRGGEGAGEGAGEGVSEDAGGMLVGGLPGGAALVERRDDANVSSNASERRVGGRRGRSGTAPANDHRDRAPVASRSCVLL